MTSSRFFSKDYCAWTISIGNEDPDINILLHLIRLNKYSKILKPIRVNVKIANKKGHPLFTKTIVIENTIDFPCSLSRISKQDLRESQFYEQDGNCTIYCTIKTWSFKVTKSGLASSKITSNVCHDELLLTHIEELFESKVLSDVNLNVGGRIFHAHKNILSARSKVFAAMFEQKTAEKFSNNLDIKDVDPDVFQEVLRYMYTGRMSSGTMDNMAVGVLAVSDKYLLDRLKTECETHLTKTAERCVGSRKFFDSCDRVIALYPAVPDEDPCDRSFW
ncbi:hypothetical protein OUZ56_020559 [Daphnia magna]|uniref:BTB domain-containing protein n=1 Tax=Daphnia magna TaxID=35525 RepID=A0ABQ9ZET2_9CRUS|nr:hypothetical protein OUZ56_020559 [Daphnia magna]